MTPHRWRRLRQFSQWFFLLLFLYLFFGALPDSTSLLPVDLFFRANPLAALSASLARLEILSSFGLALVVVGLTLAFGRVWCGWICPLGTLLELFAFRPRWQRSVPESWRRVKYLLLITLLILALLANQTLMAFDPIAILTRTLAAAVLPPLNALVTEIASSLYAFPLLQRPLGTVEGYIRGPMLPLLQPYFQLNLLLASFFVGLVALNALAPRFWCRYLCPLGGLLGILSKISLVRRTVGAGCNNCATCVTACPTGTIDPSRGFASDPGECTVCFDCLTDCPRSGIEFRVMTRPASWREYDPSRRMVLASALTAVTGLALLQTVPAAFRRFSTLIRPPGSVEETLLTRCIRCGECMQVCPTAGLQPSLLEADLTGLWTPRLVPRLGYCDYGCNNCGQVCPTEAIPRLTLEEKRRVVMGLAYIDTDRCIPWADDVDCIVCEEMCPTPEKAIVLDDVEVPDGQGGTRVVRRPRVLRGLCIGCGICEFKCPLEGESAIRVYTPTVEVALP